MFLNLVSTLLDAGGPVLVTVLGLIFLIPVILSVIAAAVILTVVIVRKNKKKAAQSEKTP